LARWWLGLLGLLLVGMIAHAVLHIGGPGADALFVKWVYNIVLVGSAGSCLARGLAIRRERAAWLILGSSLLLWAAGNIYFTIVLYNAKHVPIPSLSDVAWLGFYPGAYLALGLLVRARVRDFRSSLWLDGVIGALTVGAVGVALILRPVLAATGGKTLSVAVALAYPMLDLTLVALVVGMLGIVGWKPGRTWILSPAGWPYSVSRTRSMPINRRREPTTRVRSSIWAGRRRPSSSGSRRGSVPASSEPPRSIVA
jgi:hypothetical protein